MKYRTTKLEPIRRIQDCILTIRNQKVILDADLSQLYGVSTKALNQAAKRNAARFPSDFVFRLTTKEKAKVVTNCDHLRRLKFSPNLPLAFTEHGAIMAANVLNSARAVEMSVYVVRAFVHQREYLAAHAQLRRKLAELEKKCDAQFAVVFETLRELMTPPEPKPKEIGFHVRERNARYHVRNNGR